MNYPYNNQNNQGQFAAASSRPQLSLGDWLSLLGREIWLMAAVFSIVALLGIAFSFTFKKKYDAEARISVLIGQEYVYNPTVGEVGQGQTPKQEEIVQSEIEILSSAQVRANALRAIGLDRVYDPKDLVVSSGPNTPEQKFNVGVDAMRQDFSSFSTPNTTAVSYTHLDVYKRQLLERVRKTPLIEQITPRGTTFSPNPLETAATEFCTWRDRIICGEVHDENAYSFGGASGHAGLFGNIDNVLDFGFDILNSKLLPQEINKKPVSYTHLDVYKRQVRPLKF